MNEKRREALLAFLNRPDAEQVTLSLSPKAAQTLKTLAAFGVSGDFPEVAQFYGSRLLEQALEDLGDDPVAMVQQLPARDPASPNVGDAAPDAVVVGTDGEPVRLSDQWSEQTALLVFLRHYG